MRYFLVSSQAKARIKKGIAEVKRLLISRGRVPSQVFKKGAYMTRRREANEVKAAARRYQLPCTSPTWKKEKSSVLSMRMEDKMAKKAALAK